MHKIKIISACLLILGAATDAGAADPKLGQTVQNNIVAMAVDLNPSYAGIKIEGGTGVLAEGAITRYRTRQVTPLQAVVGTSAIGNNVQQNAGAPAANAGPR